MISLLFAYQQTIQLVIGVPRVFNEFISNPIMLTAIDNRIIQHAELPVVTNEVSVSLRLNIQSHDPAWACVFHKGNITNVSNVICKE